ncbi:protein of unknown function [endosymbiont DhMRE of Dentiscutata heterogama]|uniref:hypothetical protein n=1 Tax=endosymbiont DhMRE of Dentiscutata heterogama TaxID=1609546 RepID=UPI000629DCC3|nr:hypothetical protein [endosymbiont DhMRE of Dentiscutata heterogama]CFW93291.1 protein of unknown function [endosymbiont DhMRE of Dentiscutata heterogama]
MFTNKMGEGIINWYLGMYIENTEYSYRINKKGISKGGTMATDPSGTSTSSIFYYKSWNEWAIFSFTDKNWLNQAENMENWLEELQPKTLLVETGKLFRNQKYNHNMVDLIRTVGALEYVAKQRTIKYEGVSNQYRDKWGNRVADKGDIAGLELKKIQGKMGAPRKVWFFKDRELNEHERDAVLIFYAWWVKRKGREWPFL